MEYAAAFLYLIGILWFSQTMYHEDGKVIPILVLTLLWPLFVLYITLFGGIDDDEDEA
jgi:hypothetical protein